MDAHSHDLFDAARRSLGNAGRLFQDYLMPQELDRLWAETARGPGGSPVFARLLAELKVEYEIPEEDLRRVPARGPVVVVANHPFGLVEGAWAP